MTRTEKKQSKVDVLNDLIKNSDTDEEKEHMELMLYRLEHGAWSDLDEFIFNVILT